MAREKTISTVPCFLNGDRSTLNHMEAALTRAGIDTKSAPAAASLASSKQPTAFCVIALHASRAQQQLQWIASARDRKFPVFAWTTDATPDPDSPQWQLERLAEGNGAIGSSSWNSIELASRVWAASEGHPPDGLTLRGGRKNNLGERTEHALSSFGLSTLGDRGWVLRPEGGNLILSRSGQPDIHCSDPILLAESISIARRASQKMEPINLAHVKVDHAEIEAIVRPPNRVLSEITSKRLLAAFGIASPSEHLCTSASEAVRLAAPLHKPVVLKLVRPAFDKKQECGAVHLGVEGPASIRRAYNNLQILGDQLGTPKALGVLLSEEIEGGNDIWLEARQSVIAGPCILWGDGNQRGRSPLSIVTCTSEAPVINQAVESTNSTLNTMQKESLKRLIATSAHILNKLEGKIGRCEIHPLRLPTDDAPPLALDALVEIRLT